VAIQAVSPANDPGEIDRVDDAVGMGVDVGAVGASMTALAIVLLAGTDVAVGAPPTCCAHPLNEMTAIKNTINCIR
jgi:hypothetical protein